MKQIQSMPDIWNDDSFTTSKSTVLGALVSCVVRQSPYLFPLDLVSGLVEFNSAFCLNDYFETSCVSLRSRVRGTFQRCPTIFGWNKPKKGSHTVVFCSRYSQPSPDCDFIDLDALARNVAYLVTLESKYNQLHQ